MERRQAGVLTQGREVRAREKGGLEGKGGLTLGRVWSSAGVLEGQSRPSRFYPRVSCWEAPEELLRW